MRAVVLALLAAGCGQVDPYTRQGMWQPEGVNAINLAASVASPRDLVRGRGEAGVDRRLATAPVERLYGGTPRPLPDLSAEAAPASGRPGGAPGAGGGPN